jgi:preprotein translocase subunit SecF
MKMKLNGSKKIILLGIILLIVAGIIVVALKGFNVSLILKQHESINVFIGKEVDINDIKTICNEVFKDKKVVLRKVELFDDSVNINVETITDEEKENLLTKINEKYETALTTDDLTVNSNSNVRIRDLVRPYVKPVIITLVLVVVYLVVRFRKMNALKLLGKIFVEIILTEALLASVIAIVRIPVSPIIINLMAVIAIIELLIYINRKEIEYKKVATEK